MIRAIGWIIKLGLFSAVVLVLGNWLGWGGKTVSDHLKTQIAHAERSETYGKVRGVTSELIEDAKEGIRGEIPQQKKHSLPQQSQQPQRIDSSTPKKLRSEEKTDDESIHSSERQKLRALIRELNYTRN